MKHAVSLYDQSFDVYDGLNSRLVEFLVADYKKENPFRDLVSREPKSVLDIGANIGMWSFWVAKRFPDARIYAVEPHPMNTIHLQAGLIENKFPNVVVLPCAVSHKAELIRLWYDPTNSGATGVFNQIYQGTVPTLVPALPLNAIFEAISDPVIDYVKIDVEGMEFELFRDFKHWDRIGYLHVELHPFPTFDNRELARAKVSEFMNTVHAGMRDKPFSLIAEDVDHIFDAVEAARKALVEASGNH